MALSNNNFFGQETLYNGILILKADLEAMSFMDGHLARCSICPRTAPVAVLDLSHLAWADFKIKVKQITQTTVHFDQWNSLLLATLRYLHVQCTVYIYISLDKYTVHLKCSMGCVNKCTQCTPNFMNLRIRHGNITCNYFQKSVIGPFEYIKT